MTPLRPGIRVLIVEDEAIIAMTAEDMVESLGCVIAGTADSVEQALEMAEDRSFDVALLDINLNGSLSLPVAARLRDLGRPFFFTTGYGSAGTGEEFPGIQVVTKPYRAGDLATAIAAVLPERD